MYTKTSSDRSCAGAARWLIASALSAFAALADAAHAQFVPDDQIVSDPTVDFNDPEFDQAGNRLAWQDTEGNLWVAYVDPVTGDMEPKTGKGQLVDTGLMDIGKSLNGPEWAYGNGQTYLLYSKAAGGQGALGTALDNGAGGWIIGPTTATTTKRWRPYGTPYGTKTPAMENYLWRRGENEILGWRYVGVPGSELSLPNLPVGMRFIAGRDAFVTTRSINGFRQVVVVDTTTGESTQLTFDSTDKTAPFIWYAPDLGEYALMVLSGANTIALYQLKRGKWKVTYSFSFPTTKQYLSSPEPFVAYGRSYIFAVAAEQVGQSGGFPAQALGATEIWIAGIDAALPLFRRVDDPVGDHHRIDPEVFITVRDALVFYVQRDEGATVSVLRRATTGLGPGTAPR